MNKVILLGRIVRDPEIRYSQSSEPMAIARYSIAVNRRFKKYGEPDADFINCVAFGRNGEFAEKWIKKGMMMSIVGHLQTGSYEKDGIRRYTTDVIIEEQHFAESKKSSERATEKPQDVGFVAIDDLDEDLDIPF
jgi:single-strand DNA-binding protein